MKLLYKVVALLMFSSAFYSCNEDKKPVENYDPIMQASWEQITQKARGSTVVWMRYMGDKKANKHMEEVIVPFIKKNFDITLKIIPGQGSGIVSSIMSEREAGLEIGEIDMVWINGETFYQLQQFNGLYGPFTAKLPSSKFINYEDPIIKYDFQQEINGFEAPWGKASFLALTDSARVKTTPISMQDFESYWKANPGKFTLPLDFSGYTLLKTWLIELAGGIQNLDGDFDQKKYDQYGTELWNFLNRNKKYFWKQGETFPESAVTVTQMFGTGEIDFSFSFGLRDVDRGVKEGLFPKTTKGFVLKAGSIQNSNYLGIPYNSANKEGAMVVINYLISPEAQIEKSDLKNSGGTPVFEIDRLTPELRARYKALPKATYGMSEQDVLAKAIKEPHSMYMIKIAEDFRKRVIDVK